MFCRLESVVLDNLSLSALRAICLLSKSMWVNNWTFDSGKKTYLLRSISCGSTPGIVTLTDVNELEVDRGGGGGLIKPIRRNSKYNGLTRILITGCIMYGKKLANVKLSAESPR